MTGGTYPLVVSVITDIFFVSILDSVTVWQCIVGISVTYDRWNVSDSSIGSDRYFRCRFIVLFSTLLQYRMNEYRVSKVDRIR